MLLAHLCTVSSHVQPEYGMQSLRQCYCIICLACQAHEAVAIMLLLKAVALGLDLCANYKAMVFGIRQGRHCSMVYKCISHHAVLQTF